MMFWNKIDLHKLNFERATPSCHCSSLASQPSSLLGPELACAPTGLGGLGGLGGLVGPGENRRSAFSLWWGFDCTVDRFTKTFFWNFQKCRAVLCYILIDKQMLHQVFCSNFAPSLSSGNHLFYKAKFMGRSCLCQVWAITFDWNLIKERYVSKTPNVTFVYLSKCNIKLPGFFGNSKTGFFEPV